MAGLELQEGSLREAAARCSEARKKPVHVGAAIMPDYLNAHYDPYGSVLERGNNGAGYHGHDAHEHARLVGSTRQCL